MLCLSLIVHLPLSQTIYLSIYPSIYLSIRPSVRPSIHPSIHPSFLSICLYIFSFDRPLVKAHYFFTDSLIGPGHLHRKKHTEPSFCVLSIPPSINQSICPTVRHVCPFVGLTVRPSIHPSSHPSLLSICLYIFFHLTDR